MSDETSIRVLRWLFFTVSVSCLPLVFTYIDAFFTSDTTPGLDVVTRRGELYLIASALCATGVGEVIGLKGGRSRRQIVAAGLSGFVASICSFAYYIVSKGVAAARVDFVTKTQFIALFAAIIVSSACIVASEIP